MAAKCWLQIQAFAARVPSSSCARRLWRVPKTLPIGWSFRQRRGRRV